MQVRGGDRGGCGGRDGGVDCVSFVGAGGRGGDGDSDGGGGDHGCDGVVLMPATTMPATSR